MAKQTKEYLPDLHDRLNDPEYAADYLNAVLTDTDQDGVEQRFLIALKDVAKAKGITNVASEADLNRQHLYTMLSESGNPELQTLKAILEAVGLCLMVSPAKMAS